KQDAGHDHVRHFTYFRGQIRRFAFKDDLREEPDKWLARTFAARSPVERSNSTFQQMFVARFWSDGQSSQDIHGMGMEVSTRPAGSHVRGDVVFESPVVSEILQLFKVVMKNFFSKLERFRVVDGTVVNCQILSNPRGHPTQYCKFTLPR